MINQCSECHKADMICFFHTKMDSYHPSHDHNIHCLFSRDEYILLCNKCYESEKDDYFRDAREVPIEMWITGVFILEGEDFPHQILWEEINHMYRARFQK